MCSKGENMNRKELVRRVAAELRDGDIRKPISIPKQVFHISDDEGHSKDFVVRKTDKSVIYTVEDVEAIIDTCLAVIEDSIKHGEPITLRGFGTLGLRYRKPRVLKHVETGEEVTAEGRYVPRFYFGNDLRMAAKVYELSLADGLIDEPLPIYNDEDGE
jgi:nucleoid DNA-binding protein